MNVNKGNLKQEEEEGTAGVDVDAENLSEVQQETIESGDGDVDGRSQEVQGGQAEVVHEDNDFGYYHDDNDDHAALNLDHNGDNDTNNDDSIRRNTFDDSIRQYVIATPAVAAKDSIFRSNRDRSRCRGRSRRKENLRGAPNQIFASSGMQHQALLRRQAGCSARYVPPPARSISNHNYVSLEMDGSLSSGQYGQQSRNDTSRVVTTDHRNQGSLENEASQYERHTNVSSNTLIHENNVNNPFVERGEIFRVPVSDDEVIRRRISIEGARDTISQSSNKVQTYSLADTYCLNNSQDNSNLPSSAWKSVQMNASSAEAVDQTNAYELESYTSAPSERSLHSGSVLNYSLYIFGGYSGNQRLNDFYSFSFHEKVWREIEKASSSDVWPSPRDRHVSAVHGNSFYVFGGFNGTRRVNDFYEFDLSTMEWQEINPSSGMPPSPRHSHAAVVHGDCFYVYGGYDGSYRCDFHNYNFVTNSWSLVPATGRPPKARYRATCVVHKNSMICFAGHDGTQHLSDTHVFDFGTKIWSRLVTEGPPPIPRDSHVSVIVGKHMWVFGGSTGSAMNDLHSLDLSCKPAIWSQSLRGGSPGHRFCHVAVAHEQIIYVYGGYNGSTRLKDFICIDLSHENLTCDIPRGTLISDLHSYINNDTFSDVTIIVEDQRIYCHKIMLMRCPYFQAMLLGEMMESTQETITLHEVRYSIFLILLEYLYTDKCIIPLDNAMEVLAAADQFCISRLKILCENKLLGSLNIENAAAIYFEADAYDAVALKSKTLRYIIDHFETISKTQCFEDMARRNVELVFEILHNR